MKRSLVFLMAGAVLSPLILFFGKLTIFAAGLVAIGAAVNIFSQEMKKLEEKDHG